MNFERMIKMANIIYRELRPTDYERIKSLINEAFGFDDFIKDKKFLNEVLNIYLQDCIMASTFSKVAVKDHQVIGLILGQAKREKKRLIKSHNIFSLLSSMGKLLLTNKTNRQALKQFAHIQTVYKELIKGKEDTFGGCIQLFIVAKESRGLGIGKTLIAYLLGYMKQKQVSSLYLYTDTRCNYGFYDSHKFVRLAQKNITFKGFKDILGVYLYGYTLH